MEDPLWSGFFLDKKPQSNLWIQFKYERLADICFINVGVWGIYKIDVPWVDHSVKQLNLKEPFEFGPWMKAETMNKRSTRWVEFLAETDQSIDDQEEEKGRHVQLELDVCREHAPGVASTKVWLAISPLAKVDVFKNC